MGRERGRGGEGRAKQREEMIERAGGSGGGEEWKMGYKVGTGQRVKEGGRKGEVGGAGRGRRVREEMRVWEGERS